MSNKGLICFITVVWFIGGSALMTMAVSITNSPVVNAILVVFLILINFAVLANSFCMQARRFHDMNFSSIWIIALFIPLIGFLFGVLLLCGSGSDSTNGFGEKPAKSPRKFLIANSIMGTILIASVAAFIMFTDGSHYSSNNINVTFPYRYTVHHQTDEGIATDVVLPARDNAEPNLMVMVRKSENSKADISYFNNFLTIGADVVASKMMFSSITDSENFH